MSYILRLYTDPNFPNMVLSAESDSWCSLREATSTTPVALLPMKVWVIGIDMSPDKKSLLLIDKLGGENRFSVSELLGCERTEY
jgi:hypothetical protein